jgi:hypothetical protein
MHDRKSPCFVKSDRKIYVELKDIVLTWYDVQDYWSGSGDESRNVKKGGGGYL